MFAERLPVGPPRIVKNCAVFGASTLRLRGVIPPTPIHRCLRHVWARLLHVELTRPVLSAATRMEILALHLRAIQTSHSTGLSSGLPLFNTFIDRRFDSALGSPRPGSPERRPEAAHES